MRLVIGAALLAASPGLLAGDLEPFLGYSGAQLFQRFCASCHGPAGYGDGPVVESLNVVIPDLTRLAKRSR
ncbi:MAG: c-type cytochrome [Gammaproteobacteria bacterium]